MVAVSVRSAGSDARITLEGHSACPEDPSDADKVEALRVCAAASMLMVTLIAHVDSERAEDVSEDRDYGFLSCDVPEAAAPQLTFVLLGLELLRSGYGERHISIDVEEAPQWLRLLL